LAYEEPDDEEEELSWSQINRHSLVAMVPIFGRNFVLTKALRARRQDIIPRISGSKREFQKTQKLL
jgi:hypothetical protein